MAARLRSGYYRQPEALASDVTLIARNAAMFNGEEGELAEDAAALASYLGAVLAGQARSPSSACLPALLCVRAGAAAAVAAAARC